MKKQNLESLEAVKHTHTHTLCLPNNSTRGTGLLAQGQVDTPLKINKTEQGITIISLVVTVIILLILAGVAINIVLGDNGLFQKSKEAVNAWKSAEENETEVLDYLYTEWDNIINGGTGTKPTTPPEEPPNPQEPILIGETVDDVKLPENTETPTTVTIGGEEVTIPPKFTIAEDSGKTVSEGIAVVDPQGNEWVWVPCYVERGKGSNIEGRIEYKRYIFGNQVFDESDNSKIYHSSSKKLFYYYEALSATSKEYLSIKKYGGYYIGRYEAGDKDLSELETPRLRTSSDKITHKVSIKKNQVPYNYVTQPQSVTLSEGMTSLDGTDTNKLNGTQVFTKLCSSYSWGTALKFIEKTHPTYGDTSQDRNGVLAGQYNNNKYGTGLLKTGKTLSVSSIYDMGGNVWECTTENCTYEVGQYVDQGGYYGNDSSEHPAGGRSSDTGIADFGIGFRPTLFVK